jgi:phosphatidylinositol alpha-1,6-mannosyltransferase
MTNNGRDNKFILFTLEFPPQKGGVSKYYFNLVNHWPGSDIVVLADGVAQEGDASNVVRRKLLFRYIFPRWLLSVYQLLVAIVQYKPSHVIVGQVLPLGIASFIVSKFFKIKYSVILHGMDFSLAIKKKKAVQKILTACENIICANSYTASELKSVFHELADKVVVVNPGIEPSLIRNPQKIEELKKKYDLFGKKVVFSMGRLVKRKGVDRVIKAMKEVLLVKNDAVLVVGGTGPYEDVLKSIAQEAGVDSDKIIFLGFIDDAEYWAWLELCDIFIMTSRNIDGDYEGFGIVYLEANLAGKPVIAGDSGGVRDAVMNNVNGLLVNPEDNKEIAAAILRLLNDEKLCHNLGSVGNRRVVEIMSAKKQAEKIYSKLAVK